MNPKVGSDKHIQCILQGVWHWQLLLVLCRDGQHILLSTHNFAPGHLLLIGQFWKSRRDTLPSYISGEVLRILLTQVIPNFGFIALKHLAFFAKSLIDGISPLLFLSFFNKHLPSMILSRMLKISFSRRSPSKHLNRAGVTMSIFFFLPSFPSGPNNSPSIHFMQTCRQ